jgi:hypothetical protein
MAEEYVFDSQQGREILLFSTTSASVMRPTELLTQWERVAVSSALKRE